MKTIKFVLVSLLLTFSIPSGTLYGQDTVKENTKGSAALKNRISVNFKNIPLKQALEEVENKGKFHLNYNDKVLPAGKKVKVKLNEATCLEVLQEILGSAPVDVAVTKGGQVILVSSDNKKGSITGTVVDMENGEPLEFANVIIVGTRLGAAVGEDGKFSISRIPVGIYSIEASYVGYRKRRIDSVEVSENKPLNFNFKLEETVTALSEMIITPGHFSIMEKEPVTNNALKEEDIRSFPQLGEDIYRAINRLPGVSGNDFSAKFTVRGGEHDEVLVMLDGMELYDPFHLKELDGFLSFVDVEAIKSIDMITGAFPSEYGNKLSGVFNMKTINHPEEKPGTHIAISFLNARFRSEGSFGGGKGNWLLVGRRGYLDLLLGLLKPTDTDINPTYYDVLSKVQYSFSPKHTVSAHFLAAYDDLEVIDENDEIYSDNGNIYGWVNWHAQYLPNLYSRTVFSRGRVDEYINAVTDPAFNGDFSGRIDDFRDFNFYGLKQDWSLDVSKRLFLKWGFEAKHLKNKYDMLFIEPVNIGDSFYNKVWVNDTTKANGISEGNKYSAYLSTRMRLFNPLTAEIGLRYDNATWSNDKNFSPRINLACDLTNRTVLRAGWGKFYQIQNVHKLNAQDGDTRFYPADLAEHRVIGFEHKFRNRTNLRIEIYHKKLLSLRPRYMNYEGPSLNPFAYAHTDRIRIEPESGGAKGVELYFHNDKGSRVNWWASYSYSKSEWMIDGKSIPTGFDQRHTIYLDLNYRFIKKWKLNIAWQCHSGWPYTVQKDRIKKWFPDGSYAIEWYPGPLNGERLPVYHRLDLRVSRYFEANHGQLFMFFELRNIYNKANTREYIYSHMGIRNGEVLVERTGEESWIPVMPSFGVSWDF